MTRTWMAADLVARLRGIGGLTQGEIAYAVGVSERTVRAWEFQGTRPRKDAHDRLVQLAEIVDKLDDHGLVPESIGTLLRLSRQHHRTSLRTSLLQDFVASPSMAALSVDDWIKDDR